MKKHKKDQAVAPKPEEPLVRPAFSDAPPGGRFNDAFRVLKSRAPPASEPAAAAPRSEAAAPEVKRRPAPARAVVRMERKGHGGKEVTVVEIDLPPAQLGSWLKLLKQTLGCGGISEEKTMVLQGDHRERVRAWLEAQGVKKVSVG